MTLPNAHTYTAQLADQLPDWTRYDDPAGTPGAAYLAHPDGHRLGLRLQSHGTIQTWITAGPLPELPAASTPDEAAKAQTALDARLQPNRTRHAVISLERVRDPHKALLTLVTRHLIPALTNKPRYAAKSDTASWDPGQPLPRLRLTRLPRRTTTKKDAQ
ncbi:hypothetical protein AB0K51_09535 [Kitasatospora sp. NPDC049285]|uniref:hypothetical protein n=1 Tax=Kitasatospora sp. NPDC049285 TaxID=3157096 RepID=UPI00342593BC